MSASFPGDDGAEQAASFLPTSNGVTPFAELCAHIYARVDKFLKDDLPTARLRNTQEQTKKSLGVIADALERYSFAELSLSYNGGKDCLVLLILYLAAIHKKSLMLQNADVLPNDNKNTPLQSVYIQAEHPFPEVESFVSLSITTYSLNLVTYAKPMKAAFAEYLKDYPLVKAIFVGTRRTDPHGAKLTHFDPTDHGWPDFMRIHPVIDWHYRDIWTFIRYLNVPYCRLYDQGYTSLGGTNDTHPNPALRRLKSLKDDNVPQLSDSFRPAYELVEDEEERLGREK